jgi:hypothetical protein
MHWPEWGETAVTVVDGLALLLLTLGAVTGSWTLTAAGSVLVLILLVTSLD